MHTGVRHAAAAIVVTIFCGIAAAGCGGGGDPKPMRPSPQSLGAFAGQQRFGPVRSVAAEWRVPGIASGSPAGRSSIWIGVQPQHPTWVPENTFIQVGTLQDRVAGKDYYYAFWSDTEHRFHPQFLIPTHPGDAVEASLTHDAAGWNVALKDTTTNLQSAFGTSDESDGTFNLAEWAEEDPSADSGDVEPFPRLGPVSVRSFTVNGAAPPAGDLYPTWMTLPKETLGPHPAPGGGVVVGSVRLSAGAARFVAIGRALGAPSDAVMPDLVQEKASVLPGLEAPAARYAAALVALAKALRTGSWPAPARTAVAALARAADIFAARLQAAPRTAAAGASWRTRVLAAEREYHAAGLVVHRALGAPIVGRTILSPN